MKGGTGVLSETYDFLNIIWNYGMRQKNPLSTKFFNKGIEAIIRRIEVKPISNNVHKCIDYADEWTWTIVAKLQKELDKNKKIYYRAQIKIKQNI